jgi:hypothetical protein
VVGTRIPLDGANDEGDDCHSQEVGVDSGGYVAGNRGDLRTCFYRWGTKSKLLRGVIEEFIDGDY